MMKRLCIAMTALTLSAQEAPQPPTAPTAPQKPHVETWHGKRVEDPYFWLREKQNPEVMAYLKAENAYTEKMTHGQKAFEEALYKEMLGRIKQTDLSVPVFKRGYEYYSRVEEGKQYPTRCRKSKGSGAKEEVYLDLNEMAKGQAFFSIGDEDFSENNQLLAYTTDTVGFRQYTLQIKDLKTNTLLTDRAERVTSLAWANNDTTLFYVTEDATTKRSNQIWRLELGKAPQMIYEEKDEHFTVDLAKTKDRKYLQAMIASTDTWECRMLSLDQPNGKLKAFWPREKGHKYTIQHREGLFYIRTNKGAKDFRIVTASAKDPSPKNWKDFVPAKAGVLIQSIELFKNHAVVSKKQKGLNCFSILNFKDQAWHEITFPETVYTAFSMGNPEYDTAVWRFGYQSLVTPNTTYDYDLQSRERKLLKQEEVLGGYKAEHYATERAWATARDGEKVPISLVYRKDLKRDGSAPCWLYAYGSYGYGQSATFNTSRVSLLDRGLVFAIAHVRGGNDLGEGWHEKGMLYNKMNTFYDFIDCADFLIQAKYTHKDGLVAEGGSAGGLLMGAIVNLRPDLWKAVHAAVPFWDVINTMMDASLPLTVGEYLEWGNPNHKKAFDYMMSYSPYDNLKKGHYPAMLVTTSFHDSQVGYWESAKYVAKLRTLKQDKNPLVLKTKLEPAGHGGASGRYDRMKDTAFEYAWMLSQLGITK